MNSFLSIIELSPNVSLDDKVSIGIIIVSPNKVWFHYDLNLLRMLKPLIKDSYPGLEKVLKMIGRKLKSLETKQLDLYLNLSEFFQKDLYEQLVTEQGGVIRFSNPQPIAIPTFTDDGFLRIFHSIIGNWESARNRSINEEKILINQKLLSPLAQSMHTNYRLGPQQVERLYFTFPLEAIGQNKDLFIVKYLDANHTNQTLERKVMRLFFLLDAIQQEYNTRVQTFIISSKPSARSRAKNYIYQLLERRKNIQLVDPSDVLQILKFLREQDVRKIWD